MSRERVLLRRVEAPRHARLLTPDDLERLLDVLEAHGPEPIGFAVEVSPDFREDLPEGWDVLRLTDYGDGEALASGPPHPDERGE